MTEPGCENRCCTTCRTTARRLNWLILIVVLFFTAHIPILAQLPKLFGGEPVALIVALVAAVAAFAVAATRRIGPYD